LPAAFDTASAALDEQAVYFVCKETLCAYSLEDGRALWKIHLPHGFNGWQAKRAGAALLVYPQETGKDRQERFALLLDPKDGQAFQSLPLPEGPAPMVLHVGDNQITARAGGATSVFRPLAPKSQP